MNTIARLILALSFIFSAFLLSAPIPTYACGDQTPVQDGCEPPKPRPNHEDNEEDNQPKTSPPVCKFNVDFPINVDLQVYAFWEFMGSADQITNWIWYWGDGTSSNESGQSSHIYEEEGTYEITLEVRRYDNESASCSQVVNIQEPIRIVQHPPTCSIEFKEMEDGVFHFSSTSSDSDGWIDSTIWNFGEGYAFFGTETDWKYSQGEYQVKLSVTDNEGFVADCARIIQYTETVPSPVPQIPTCSQEIKSGDNSVNNYNVCGNNTITITQTNDTTVTNQLEYLTQNIEAMMMEQELQTGMIANLQEQLVDHDNRLVNFEELQLPITMATYELLRTVHHKVSRILNIIIFIWDFLIPGVG